jgi:hypothetical protein
VAAIAVALGSAAVVAAVVGGTAGVAVGSASSSPEQAVVMSDMTATATSPRIQELRFIVAI